MLRIKTAAAAKKTTRSTATGISRAIILSKQIGRMKFPGLFRSVWTGSGRIPEELLRELHGGIALTEQVKMHASSDPRKPLYVLGEYLTSYHTGRHIMLYGGSIDRVYGHLPDEELKKELDRIIRHELTHHIESLSGIRDLEVYDEVMLKEYCDELK